MSRLWATRARPSARRRSRRTWILSGDVPDSYIRKAQMKGFMLSTQHRTNIRPRQRSAEVHETCKLRRMRIKTFMCPHDLRACLCGSRWEAHAETLLHECNKLCPWVSFQDAARGDLQSETCCNRAFGMYKLSAFQHRLMHVMQVSANNPGCPTQLSTEVMRWNPSPLQKSKLRDHPPI